MKKDIIELFTDIDDDLIADAMPEAQRPIEMKADTRRFSWGKFAAAAACLAVVVVGGAFALKAVSGRGGLVYSENAGSSNLDPAKSAASDPYSPTVLPEPAGADHPSDHPTDYPEEAKYQYTGDFSELELCGYACEEREGYRSFDKLVEDSDLIVVGTFVDDARQNRPTDRLSHQSSWGTSFNKLRIDRVFSGDAEVGEEIIIFDRYYVTEGKLMYVSGGSLTPMIKGEQWVYFLEKASPEYGDYYQPLLTNGRYPVPGNENTFVLTESHYNEDIYADVKKMLGYAGEVEIVGEHRTEGDEITFAMPEFPGDKFVWWEWTVEVFHKGSKNPSTLYCAPCITSLYLADLNSDGKRELIGVSLDDGAEMSAGFIRIYDYANSMIYPFDPEAERSYDLEMRDNELYIVISATDTGKEVSAEPLTDFIAKNPVVKNNPEFDDKTSPPGESNYVEKVEYKDWKITNEFTMPEFPGDKFMWNRKSISVLDSKKTVYELCETSGISSVYLADLNGDGKRELVILCRNGSGLTANELIVFDYANSKRYTLKTDKTTLSYELEIRGKELYVVTRLLGDYKAVSSEPLTLGMLSPITRCGLDNQD